MKKIIFVSAAIAVLCSCAKEMTPSIPVSDGLRFVTINANVDNLGEEEIDDAKAYYDFYDKVNYKFKWLGGGNEKIGAFDNKAAVDGGHEFLTVKGEINNNKAKIAGKISDDATGKVVFLYPKQSNTYSAGNLTHKTNISGNNITSVFIPYENMVKPNTMDVYSATRIGVISDASKIESENLNMYNPLAAVKLTLKNCTEDHPLKSIEIFGNNGEKLAGYCDIDFSEQGNPKPVFKENPVLGSQGQCVAFDLTLTPHSDVGTEFKDNTYIAALAPTTFSKGVTLKFVDSKGYVAFLGSNKALTISRNHIKNLGEIDVKALDWHYAVNLHFANISFADKLKKATVTTISEDGKRPDKPYTPNGDDTGINTSFSKQAPFYTGSTEKISFTLYLGDKTSDKENPKSGRWANGFEYNGMGSYLEFPSLEGKILTKIWIRSFGNGNYSGNLCIVRASDGKYLKKDGSWAAVAAGKKIADDPDADIWTGKKTVGLHKSWDNCFATGESYRIQTTHADAACIKDLILFYDDVTKATALTSAPQVNDWNLGEGAEALMY